eukprot:2880215-Rhodomonas_salina.1
MSDTEITYRVQSAYALAMRCPVLTQPPALRACARATPSPSSYDSAQKLPNSWTEGEQLMLYFAVSTTVTVSNVVFESVVGALTIFEKHARCAHRPPPFVYCTVHTRTPFVYRTTAHCHPLLVPHSAHAHIVCVPD